LWIAHDPGVRLRDIVANLVGGGYVHEAKQGRRNGSSIHVDKPLPEAFLRQRSSGHRASMGG
jgi:hypothetical protein